MTYRAVNQNTFSGGFWTARQIESVKNRISAAIDGEQDPESTKALLRSFAMTIEHLARDYNYHALKVIVDEWSDAEDLLIEQSMAEAEAAAVTRDKS